MILPEQFRKYFLMGVFLSVTVVFATAPVHGSMKGSHSSMGGQEGQDMPKMESSPVDQDAVNRVKIKMQELELAGVKTEPAERRRLHKTIRAVGTVAYDPKLAVTEDEFISAVKSYEKAKTGSNPEIAERAGALLESSRRKLTLLGVNEKQIDHLAKTQKSSGNLILPRDQVWIYADVYEFELSWVKPAIPIQVTTIAYPAEVFKGEIDSINPTLKPSTRSVTVRARVDNPQLLLKPDMYVDVMIESPYVSMDGQQHVLAIPKDALLDTGARKVVWVDLGDGNFEGRVVKVGPLAYGDHMEQAYYPVLSGLSEGEKVVTRANFLIDSQSQITGVAGAAYGGSLEGESKPMPGHVH